MAEVTVSGLSKTFPGKTQVPALTDVNFTVPDGEMLVLLGPSGCGKTTTLRCLAGLETPDSGVIQFGEQAVYDGGLGTAVPAHRRDIGLVFQSFALWPHMSVRRNIEFPLRTRRWPGPERRRAVESAAAMVELAPNLLDKKPHQLSGGQQQRVSLARALVAQPALVLFDEPLSSLDTQLRLQVRSELHKLHRSLGFTGVYVTHDLSEALALGNRIAVMGQGRVEQIGSPETVFEHPASPAVARLFGYACVSPESANVDTTSHRAVASTYVRPDRLRVANERPVADRHARFRGQRVVDVAYLGTQVELTLDSGADILRIPLAAEEAATLRPGNVVELIAERDDLRQFNSDGLPVLKARSVGPGVDRTQMVALPPHGQAVLPR